ncbi:MAG: hypothetical protein Q8N96_10415 [Methylovulum sp.]|nr:hypothetical protein [Methylovulum sp.]
MAACKLDNEAISKAMYFRDVTVETEIDRMKSEFLSADVQCMALPILLLARGFDKTTAHAPLRRPLLTKPTSLI